MTSAAATGRGVPVPSTCEARTGGRALCDVAHFPSEFPRLTCAADLLHRDLGARVEVSVSARPTDPWTWQLGSSAGRTDSTRLHPAEVSAD